ncbi:MAG: Ribosome biogenesis GTPase A [Pelotomaculum sp. PtaU1.Bin065]|nr:MAG: Ribosome biogenesis GTPase A [Pelotomaculum sp. PtaU1.Bin065]
MWVKRWFFTGHPAGPAWYGSMDIQWYPGHMAKAKREVKENLKLVDVVIEVLDARIPASSRNPDINEITGRKPKLVILNKSDLADPDLTGIWLKKFINSGIPAAAVDLRSGRGVRAVPVLVGQLAAPKMDSLISAGRRPRAARCIVLGIPNVGKSFLINKLADRRAARTGYKPGVTRGQQWVRMAGNLELMDTPGILWPKFGDPEAAFRLAVTGAVREEVFNIYDVAGRLAKWLAKNCPEAIKKRYKLQDLPEDAGELLELIGMSRGFIGSGGVVDLQKSAHNVLKEFREGKFGRITLDYPENI